MRVQAFESALSLTDRLVEVDDDSGRQLFVPTPLGKAAPCDAKNPDQWFTITARDKQTYAISNASAFLQHSPTSGLILEELGDAPLRSTFRFVDNGPAPRVGG